jgi:hypothetical protein
MKTTEELQQIAQNIYDKARQLEADSLPGINKLVTGGVTPAEQVESLLEKLAASLPDDCTADEWNTIQTMLAHKLEEMEARSVISGGQRLTNQELQDLTRRDFRKEE